MAASQRRSRFNVCGEERNPIARGKTGFTEKAKGSVEKKPLGNRKKLGESQKLLRIRIGGGTTPNAGLARKLGIGTTWRAP